MFKILLIVTGIVAPGEPPRTIGIGVAEPTYASFALCEADRTSETFKKVQANVLAQMKQKFSNINVSVESKCEDITPHLKPEQKSI